MAPLPTVAAGPLSARVSAALAGVLGIIANGFLIGFFVLTYPDFSDPTWGWLGPANDLLVAGQFLAMMPVIFAVARLLPIGRLTTVATAVALVSCTAVAVLSLALVLGLIDFDAQIGLVLGSLVPVFGWLVVAGSVAHRTGSLPRSATISSLLLGTTWLVALLLTLAALLAGGFEMPSAELTLPGVLLVLGMVLGGLAWLLLPLWPLLLARTVFGSRRPRPHPTTDIPTDLEVQR